MQFWNYNVFLMKLPQQHLLIFYRPLFFKYTTLLRYGIIIILQVMLKYRDMILEYDGHRRLYGYILFVGGRIMHIIKNQ